MRLLALLLPNFVPQFFELFLQRPVEFNVNNFCRRLSLQSQRLVEKHQYYNVYDVVFLI